MSKLLIDAVDILEVLDAIHGAGDFSAVDTETLRALADGDLLEDHERARIDAELEKRSRG